MKVKGKNVIFINGRHYDAATGLPVAEHTPAATAAPSRPVISDVAPAMPRTHEPVIPASARQNITRRTPVASVHAAPQRSKTLRRETVQRPVGQHEAVITRQHRERIVVAKSPAITKFADRPQSRTIAHTVTPAAEAPQPQALSPIVGHVHKTIADKKAVATPAKKTAATSSSHLKQQLIREKLASIDTDKKPRQHKVKRRRSRNLSVATACVALVAFAGYLTYLNMPNLSVRVAAAQAGIDASFPEYRPDGYRFDGPIAYAPGEISMKFRSNTDSRSYEITQTNSSWDSQAVLDNYVAKKTESYLTYSEQGLTIYTFAGEAAWVNGGVLYTIEGDAPLTSQQVLRIAGSM